MLPIGEFNDCRARNYLAQAAAIFLRWICIAFMDILNNSISSIQLDRSQNRSRQLLTQLQQAGLFRALVNASQGNRVVLDTAFGQIVGKAPEQLGKGDEILARLIPGKNEPTIKIEQYQPRLISLNKRLFGNLFSAPNPQPQMARVLGHQNSHTMLQIADQQYPIARQKLLQPGETLMIKTSTANNVDLIRIPVQQVLKSALSELLPRSLPDARSSGIPQLHKVANQILQIKPEALVANRQLQAALSDNIPPQKILHGGQQRQPQAPQPGRGEPQQLQLLLSQLARPLAKLDGFDAQSMPQILKLLTLIKPAATQPGSNPPATYPDLISTLKDLLMRSPDSLRQLVRTLIEANPASDRKTPMEHLLLETSSGFKNELLQQLEQTQSQLLLQKTSLRLQLEQNQPIQLNLNIPLQINQQTSEVKIQIRQKQAHQDPDEEHWEINLSFEFGLLGLISTHILLQGQKISAQFWAIESTTKQLIDTQLQQFKSQLQKSGFELGLFDCYIGQPVTQPEIPVVISDNLVDIEV